MRARWFLALLAAGLIASGMPVHADHGPDRVEVADETLADPIDPLGEPATVLLDVRIPCEEDERATAWTRALLVDAPGFTVFQPASVTNATTPVCHEADDTLTVGLPVAFGFTQEAPAFEQLTTTVEVRVQKNHTDGNVTQLPPAQANVSLTPGYFSLYNARVDRKIGEAGPQDSVRYPILIENFSNGPTRFEFAIAHPDAVPDGFQPVVPEPMVLESEATGGTKTSGQVAFTVYTPFHNGYVNEVGAIQLRIDSFYAGDADVQGDTSHVSTLTKARGFHVPGPGLAVLATVLTGAALVAGRSRLGV